MTPDQTLHNIDELYMARCIELARHAQGRTSPNPMVGAVVVSAQGRIIGEGWHHRAGEPHAEVNALRSVADESLLPGATIYVSLEPCAHYGRTPPCADLIIAKGLRRCVVGCTDTFDKVDGRGIQKLRAAGIEVTVGVLEEECRWLNRRFFCVQEKRRPWVILKWAQTADGLMGAATAPLHEGGRPLPLAISDAQCLRRVHRQRAAEDAILIGRGTAEADNPSLTLRHWAGRAPLRFVVDARLSLDYSASSHLNLVRTASAAAPLTVINAVRQAADGSVHWVLPAAHDNGRIDPQHILQCVLDAGCQSVIVEGGRHTLQSFIDAGLWDEAYVYQARQSFDVLAAQTQTATPLFPGTRAPELHASPASSETVGNCIVWKYRKG